MKKVFVELSPILRQKTMRWNDSVAPDRDIVDELSQIFMKG